MFQFSFKALYVFLYVRRYTVTQFGRLRNRKDSINWSNIKNLLLLLLKISIVLKILKQQYYFKAPKLLSTYLFIYFFHRANLRWSNGQTHIKQSRIKLDQPKVSFSYHYQYGLN